MAGPSPGHRVDDSKDLAAEIELTALAQTPGRRALRLALRFGPALLIVIAVILIVRSGLLGRLSLEGLKSSRGTLLAFVHAHPLESLGLYAAVYVATVALSLPTALILTLTGGFLFGVWLGGATAAVGCTLGAVVVFLVSRLTAGDAVETRTGPRVRALAEEIKKDAFLYLLTLRLIPVMPFWLTNVAAGLIAIRVSTFAAATLIGILPVAMIYAGQGQDQGGGQGQGDGGHIDRQVEEQAPGRVSVDEGQQGPTTGLQAVDRQAADQARAQQDHDGQQNQQGRAETQGQAQPVPLRRPGQAGQLDFGDQVLVLIVHAISRSRKACACNAFSPRRPPPPPIRSRPLARGRPGRA